MAVAFDSSLEGIDWAQAGVCNAYLLDVWTWQVPGQHIGLQTAEAQALYGSLGFAPQPDFMSTVVGRRLGNEANR